MPYPIMEPKRPSSEREHGAPPTTLRVPSPHDLPPPYVDTRLVRPETREEMLDGRLLEAAPANPEHGDVHTLLDRVLGTHAAPDRTPSTDLLTRADESSDFATDLSIRRSGIDPRTGSRTGSRYLEELAFEVVDEQSMPTMIARARKLSACGVRRIFAVFVEKHEVGEWSPEQNRFVPLPLDGTIEDRALVCAVPIRALFDPAAADAALVDALEAKQNPRLAEKLAKSRADGRAHAHAHAEGRAEAFAAAIDAICDLLGIPLGPRELEALGSMDANARAALLAHLKTERRWPDD